MLTETQQQQFQEDGFVVAHNFFDASKIEQLILAWHEVKADLAANTGRYQRADRFVVGKPPAVLEKLYQDPSLLKAANILLGEEHLSLYLSNFLLKDEGWDGEVQTHQDFAYMHGLQQKLITFVPLQPQNEDNGGLKLLQGSHRYGPIGIRGTIHFEQFSDLEVVCPSLEVGDVLFMNVLTWHYSERTRVRKERPMLQIVYQSAKDGSYSGLEQPTLLAGQWQTSYFLPYGSGITPDLTTIQEMHQQEAAQIRQEATQLKQEVTQLQQSVTQLESCLTDTKLNLEQAYQQATELQNQIAAMETSKFWKLRTKWVQLKHTALKGKA